jgi:molybdenum cofactor cytidylyltransferase
MIAALVLAAGMSRRMGTNKLLLPFGERTVLGQVIAVLQDCPLDEIVVVTGHEGKQVRASLDRQALRHRGLHFAHNPCYASGEMLSSVQAGLEEMRSDCDAALVVLGDQPQLERRVVEQVIAARQPGAVMVPSFDRRSGHPILVDRARWADVLALPPGANLREVLRAHADWVCYVEVDTETILRDVDTPEDYERMVGKR